MGKPTIDKAALAEAVRKTAKLRVEDVGGDKSRPAETVRSCLNRGFSGLGSDEGLSYILRHAVKYYLAAATAREKAPVACGGCGETEPAKRCIGCLADFGPASLHQQETADEIADETVETAAPMFQFRIGDGELVFEIPGSIIVSVEPDGAGYAFFDHETNQWVSGEHLIAEDIEAAGMEIAKALAGTCDAYDKGHDDAMAGAAVHAIREMLNEIGVPQAAFIDDHVRNGLVWARRQALEEALAAAETVKNIPPESWEVSLVVKAIRELIDDKEQGGHA